MNTNVRGTECYELTQDALQQDPPYEQRYGVTSVEGLSCMELGPV